MKLLKNIQTIWKTIDGLKTVIGGNLIGLVTACQYAGIDLGDSTTKKITAAGIVMLYTGSLHKVQKWYSKVNERK